MFCVQVLNSVQGIISSVSSNPPENSFSSTVFYETDYVEMTANSSGSKDIENVLRKKVREKDL